MSTLQIVLRILMAIVLLTIAVGFIDRPSNLYVAAGLVLVVVAAWLLTKPIKHLFRNILK